MTSILEQGGVELRVRDGVGHVSFYHPKGNSLPGALLRRLAEVITEVGRNDDARVIYLTSGGEGPFCAGASFDELQSIGTEEQGREFFMGFARVILAMKSAPKFVVARVHGKIVGGGVGLVAAADYAFALRHCSARLSELALGIGPFVVGPCVERRIGSGPFGAMSIDAGWRDAEWALQHGLYARLFDDVGAMDRALQEFTSTLAASSPEAMRELKLALWRGTADWEELLPERAAVSGRLVLSDYAKRAIASVKRA